MAKHSISKCAKRRNKLRHEGDWPTLIATNLHMKRGAISLPITTRILCKPLVANNKSSQFDTY
jgi:hypothetical protein